MIVKGSKQLGTFRRGINLYVPKITGLITNGLIVKLDAGNTVSYSGSGNTWTNLIDNSNYTINNGSFNSANGGSIVFNGTSTYVPIGTPLSNNTNYSIEAWVNASAIDQSHNIVSSENNVFWIAAGTLYGGIAGNYQQVSSASFPTNIWKYVALTFDDSSNTMTLYINGSQINQNTNVTSNYTSEILRIGSHYAGSPKAPVSFFNGKISKVRIYNRALSSSQISQNYNFEKSIFGL